MGRPDPDFALCRRQPSSFRVVAQNVKKWIFAREKILCPLNISKMLNTTNAPVKIKEEVLKPLSMKMDCTPLLSFTLCNNFLVKITNFIVKIVVSYHSQIQFFFKIFHFFTVSKIFKISKDLIPPPPKKKQFK